MDNAISNVKNKSYKSFIIRIVISLVGVSLVGFGLAFNSAGALGNDPVAVLYDGARNMLGLQPEKLGLVTNLVNFILLAMVFIFGRRYINIGTFIYALPMGNFVSIGFKFYESLNITSSLGGRILTSFCGCSMLFLGIGIFIAVNIGMDPVTGVIMVLRDKINAQYKIAKIICDVISLLLGFTLGGKIGVVTVIAACIAGPIIQKISEVFDKTILKKMNLSKLVVE
ncbi:hypothetical protein JHL18_09710 [Clostridium sp. YIM B02505]|uniref:YitT family protein n=1 Tax=Clostridium yunnanense TaxID=2800325 RepID=A0ABS1ENF6_9CLOT|nr:hypothetical protein [Clostridium yunnanense]MBK1810900.1 hypothetical protein [Clostridium yunnanense]